MHELQRNIQICADGKHRKVAPFRQRYPRWWLVPIDRIGLGASTIEGGLFSGRVCVHHPWDRLVLVSPRDPAQWVDVPSKSTAI